jgi:uncharacterized lipoprotein YddW (UPF0748 family)
LDPPQSVAVSPAALHLAVGQAQRLSVSVILESGASVDIPFGAAFMITDGAVASVQGDGTVLALAAGEASITAHVMGIASEPVAVSVVSMIEARGIWVTRWDFDAEGDIEAILDVVKEAGFNQVYWQVRGRADAFYRSTLEPWGSELAGTLGEDPGFDPLQLALNGAHARGMELHAWVNTFPAWSGTAEIPETTPTHVLCAHPDWKQIDASGNAPAAGYTTLSPGNPDVRNHIEAVLREICAYDIDGLHLDYIRYSGSQYSHDAASEDALATARADRPTLTREDFQREAVADMVTRARNALQEQHPTKPLSAAVWFIYENTFGWSSVSAGNTSFYQDTEMWLGNGDVDVLVPMLYFPLTTPPGERLDFLTLVDDHVARAGVVNRVVYAGYDAAYDSFDEIASQIAVAREHGAWGTVGFAYSTFVSKGWFDEMRSGPFSATAEVPVLPWLAR